MCGLKEVLKNLKLKKLKCVIIPPNLDKIQSEGKYQELPVEYNHEIPSIGGINDFVAQIIELCEQLCVPAIFATSRRRLAVLLHKKHRIGCVGIFYYDGAEVFGR